MKEIVSEYDFKQVITAPAEELPGIENQISGDGIIKLDEMGQFIGRITSDSQELEYKCNAEPGQCLHSESCSQYRFLPRDSGLFQRMPFTSKGIEDAHEIRKNCERPFNLLKNQVGLEKVRVRSQHATMSRCTFATIAVLLIKMAGKRKKRKIAKKPMYLLERCAHM